MGHARLEVRLQDRHGIHDGAAHTAFVNASDVEVDPLSAARHLASRTPDGFRNRRRSFGPDLGWRTESTLRTQVATNSPLRRLDDKEPPGQTCKVIYQPSDGTSQAPNAVRRIIYEAAENPQLT